MYLIERDVIKFVSDMQQVMVSSTNETDRQNITEILLKVALKTIILNLNWAFWVITSTKLVAPKENRYLPVFVIDLNICMTVNRDGLMNTLVMTNVLSFSKVGWRLGFKTHIQSRKYILFQYKTNWSFFN
jgi:hypothetical protein